MSGHPTPAILEKRIWKPFLLNLTLVVVLFSIGLLAGMLIRSRNAADSQVLARGRSHFATILMTRRWNAEHGGVYVEKKPGVASNPYLKNPDILAADGKVYTKKNPALMTREISEIALRGEDLRFHITSLRPLNPDNAPDPFEREALAAFERGETEYTTRTSLGGRTWFRYMAPLMVENSCLACHADQGYKEGDVRGGVSITYDITELEKAYWSSTVFLVVVLALVTIALLTFIYLFVARLMRALKEAHDKINEIATIDALTGVLNRRALIEGCEAEFSRARRHNRTMSLVMIDIDRFKNVNDDFGHLSGDAVLRSLGGLFNHEKRIDDIVGRFGGEEFLMLLPETDGSGGLTKAEMIRRKVEAMEVPIEEGKILKISASFGVAELKPSHESLDRLLANADKALYLAKAKGRNIVILAE